MMNRAVIYCRCSTEEESQKNALVQQVAEAKNCAEQNGWFLVDEYIESRSGTTTSKREQYNRLVEDLSLDKFDIIIIKSQDRLMRNTKDWYIFLDHLVSSQKQLYMYLEHKFYSPDEALITGIKAILAEEYSRELSKKINNAHNNRQSNNGAPILTGRTYGLKKMPDKSYTLIEEEVKVKQLIYQLAAEGYGSRTIANILKNKGIKNRYGTYFNATNILRMIRNPLNKGTVVMNTRHFDFESKKIIKVPEEEHYVYENKVPAIVSDELWQLANDQVSKRKRSKKQTGTQCIKKKDIPLLSGKLICGLCGSKYYHGARRKYKDHTIVYGWRCGRYLEVGRNVGPSAKPHLRKIQLDKVEGCDNIHLEDIPLNSLLQKVIEENYQANRDNIIHEMTDMLKRVLKERDVQKEIDKEMAVQNKILKQMDILLEKLLDGVLSDEMYKRKHDKFEEALEECREKLKRLELEKMKGSGLENRIHSIEHALCKKEIFDRATIEEMLEEIDYIQVFPTCFIIKYNIPKMMHVNSLILSEDIMKNIEEKELRVDFGHYFDYRKKKQDQRERVVEMMKENPRITARIIAEKMGLSISGVYYQINILKKEGRIFFNGKGGSGEWIIIEDEEKEVT